MVGRLPERRDRPLCHPAPSGQVTSMYGMYWRCEQEQALDGQKELDYIWAAGTGAHTRFGI